MKNKKLRVLIIEDSEDDFSMLLRELNKGPYEIEYLLVEDEIGLKQALMEDWNVVISDYSLPTFTGADALKVCINKGLDIPFIMVSGTVGEDIAVKMMKSGAKDYIMKNSLARLLPAIEREIEDANTRRERKQAAEALKVNEQLYRSLFDQANEGLVLTTLGGRLSQVNQAFADMHGYSIDELMNMDVIDFELLNKGLFEDREDIIRRLESGEFVRYEVEHYHKDGRLIPLSVSISKIDVGDGYYLSFYQDITERREAEAAVQKKMDDLVWFNNITVGRELKMIELKKEVNELLKKLGEHVKYENYT